MFKPNDYEEAVTILDDMLTRWVFDDGFCYVYYWTWADDERLGYTTSHYFRYEDLRECLDLNDWEDEDRWVNKTFGDAYHFDTEFDDIYTKEELVEEANELKDIPVHLISEAMEILKRNVYADEYVNLATAYM